MKFPKVLFLDFDGVLNRDFHSKITIEPDCAANLNSILAQFPDWDVVLSTGWREWHPLDEMEALLISLGLRIEGRLIGTTPWIGSDTLIARGFEIKAWMRVNPVEAYFVLDDMDVTNVVPPEHFHQCEMKTGLTLQCAMTVMDKMRALEDRKPVEIAKLSPSDVGAKVVYRDFGRALEGEITSWNDRYVFVRFNSPNGQACEPRDLSWANPHRGRL